MNNSNSPNWVSCWTTPARSCASAHMSESRKTSRSFPLHSRVSEGKTEREEKPSVARVPLPLAEEYAKRTPTGASAEEFRLNSGYGGYPLLPRQSEPSLPSPVLSNKSDDSDGKDFDHPMPASKRVLSEKNRGERMEAARRSDLFCHPAAMRKFHERGNMLATFAQGMEDEESVIAPTGGAVRNAALRFTENDVNMVRELAKMLMVEHEKERYARERAIASENNK